MRSFERAFTIGRADHCDVQLMTRIVSGVHARVSFTRDQWRVQDLDSRNGTFLNGERVQHAQLQGKVALQLGSGGPVLDVSVGQSLGDSKPSVGAPAASKPVSPSAAPRATTLAVPAQVFRASRFAVTMPEEWQDKTVYILAGPLADGLQHNVTVNVEPDVPFDTMEAYAHTQVDALEASLHSCQVLKEEPIALHNGLPAYRVLFVWYPKEAMKIYQEQVYILHEGTGYRLTATFTPKTRKTLGRQVEDIMRSFEPTPSAPAHP